MPDLELAVQRADPVGQVGEPGFKLVLGLARCVLGDLDHEPVAVMPDIQCHAAGCGQRIQSVDDLLLGLTRVRPSV